MAQTPSRVLSLLDAVWKPALALAKKEAKALYNSGLYYNKKILSKKQISLCSIELKKYKESLELIHT